MMPLRLGPLNVPGFSVLRSGIRWLRKDGDACRAGEIIAFCNVGLLAAAKDRRDPTPFADEWRDFQIAFAPRVGGQLRKAAHTSQGGFMDEFVCHRWEPDFIIGHMTEPTPEVRSSHRAGDELRLLMVTGRRMTELAEIRAGLLTGWHERSRAWWDDDAGDFGTLMSLGMCEQAGIVRGERLAFLELFDAVPGSAQAVFVLDEPLVPCARIVAEQFARSKVQSEEIAADLARTFAAGPVVPTASDWLFAGSLLSALQRSPLTDRYDVLTRTGLRETGPADAVILSLNAESEVILRHRRLGYGVSCYAFRVAGTGPAVRAWLRTNFEPIKRTPDDIRSDYRNLVDLVSARSDMKFLILNSMSTIGSENIVSYVPFERPLGNTLIGIHNKEQNLMLHDLARERDVSIVDCDAISAELGTAANLLDTTHHSGLLQSEIRREILRILRDRGVPGFSRALVN
jgi:hypothetical protein